MCGVHLMAFNIYYAGIFTSFPFPIFFFSFYLYYFVCIRLLRVVAVTGSLRFVVAMPCMPNQSAEDVRWRLHINFAVLRFRLQPSLAGNVLRAELCFGSFSEHCFWCRRIHLLVVYGQIRITSVDFWFCVCVFGVGAGDGNGGLRSGAYAVNNTCNRFIKWKQQH